MQQQNDIEKLKLACMFSKAAVMTVSFFSFQFRRSKIVVSIH